MTPDDLSVLRQTPFAEAVAKLEELMTQSGRAFLLGAGCSTCAGLPPTAELTEKALQSSELGASTKQIIEDLKLQFLGASDANIEDYLSELIDLLAIAERRASRGATKKHIELNGRDYAPDQLREATEQIKQAIAAVVDRDITITTHWNFVRAVHRPLRPGKMVNNQPVDYLVLNYDTLIEDALALERLPFADGLEGGVTAWWNPSTFTQNGLAARVLKLHGSINWCEFLDDPLPRRVPKSVSIPSAKDRRILIWPASTKYQETQKDPFAQIMALVRQVLRPPERSQKVLAICGYRFGDSHINAEIDKALRESAERLTVIIFSSVTQLSGQLKAWHEDHSIRDQVVIFSKGGFFHGDNSTTSTEELPWWKFENITRLLGGER